MSVSVFDLFRVGIGPSSSHTVGPMRAAALFLETLKTRQLLDNVDGVKVVLMGSLAATGRGHATDKATLLGLMGERPDTVDPDLVDQKVAEIESTKTLKLAGLHVVPFDVNKDITFAPSIVPPFHTNAMDLTVLSQGEVLYTRRYYSTGGGFVVEAKEGEPDVPLLSQGNDQTSAPRPYEYKSAQELLILAKEYKISLADIMRANEEARHPGMDIDAGLQKIWGVMKACIDRGFRVTTPLPGPFKIVRRAHQLKEELLRCKCDPLAILDWVNAYAIAVSEENAAGGRVVTAPTNGAAGIIPAVIEYLSLIHISEPTRPY